MAEFSQDDEYVTSFPTFSEESNSEEKTSNETKETNLKSESKFEESKVIDSDNKKSSKDNETIMKEMIPIDPIEKIKYFFTKMGCRTNIQNGTFVGGILFIILFLFLRYCSIKYFMFFSLIPLCYGLFGSRTFALGDLNGKVILITGASSGLGRGLALSSAQKGAKTIILVARSQKGLSETYDQIKQMKLNKTCEVVIMKCDVTISDEVSKLVTKCQTNYGNINLLINCAGSGDWKPILQTSPKEAAAHIACPYLAAYNMTYAFLPMLITGGKNGQKVHIMNVTSAAAYTGWRGSASYGSARWAMRGFSEYLRCEVKDYQIGVTLVNPGQIRGTAYAENNNIDFEHLPWIFAKGYNSPRAYDCEMVASRALRGCADGECEVHVPGPMAHSFVWLTAYLPSVAWFIIDIKPFWLKKTTEAKKDN